MTAQKMATPRPVLPNLWVKLALIILMADSIALFRLNLATSREIQTKIG